MKKYRISRNNMAYAQMGAQQPSQEEMMMMQQQAQQQEGAPQEDPQKQIMQLAQQASAEIQKGKPADVLTQELLEGGVPPQAIGQAFQMLVEQGVVDESEMQMVVQVLQSSQGEQQQAQPSQEEMMAMQQQQAAPQQPPMARAGYIKQGMKARAGMSVDQEAGFASATNLIADKNMQKNNLLKFTQDNVAANQLGQQYDQMYANGGGLEQARYGRGKARRAARRAGRNADQGTNFAKNQGRRSRQLARRAVKEMPDVYSRADRRALREGLESGEFDKYDVYRGMDVFNPQPQSKPGYPEVDAGAWDQTMMPGKDWGTETSIDEMRQRAAESGNALTGPDEVIEETSAEEMNNAGVTDNMSFSEAFGKANSDLGEAGTFMWRGKKYGTRRASDEGGDFINADDADVTITPTDDNPEPDNPNMQKALDGEWYDTTDMPEDAYQQLFDPDFYDPNNTQIDDSDGSSAYGDETEDDYDEQYFVEYDDDGNVINQPVGDFTPFDQRDDKDNLDYGTWLRDLPYDENGFAYDRDGNMYDIDDYNRSFNRSGLNNPFDNDDAHNRAIDFSNMGYSGYSGDGIRRGTGQGWRGANLENTTQPVYYDENGEPIGGEPGMQFGGQYSNDGLEMARFGRGRARRQARRAGRQARRAGRQAGRGLGQMDRAMRGAYGNIAFPPGVSPMMAGMPMIGPNGAGANMMQFHGRRGLLGGLREFSMNMPVNFGRGMFMNGMFNPYGMQGGYNDMKYKITYPGESSEVEEVEQKEKNKATNDAIADDANGGGGTGGSGSDWDCETCEDGSQMGKDPAGDCIPCKEAEEDCTRTTEDCVEEFGEGYELGIGCECKRTGDGEGDSEGGTKKGKCNETEAITVNAMPVEDRNEYCAKKMAAKAEQNGMTYIWNPDKCECSSISSGSLLTWQNAVIGAVVIGGVVYLKKSGKLKKIANATSSRFKKIQNKVISLYNKGTAKAAAEADALIKNKNIKLLEAGSEFFVGNKPRGVNPRVTTNFPQPNISGSGPASGPASRVTPAANTAGATTAERQAMSQLTGSPTPKQISTGPVRKSLTQGARTFTATEKAIARGNIAILEGLSMQQIKAIAAKNGLKTTGSKGQIIRRLKNTLRGIAKGAYQAGGSVDPNLYMFTGGGAPDYVDYFGDGGYYNEGGYYEDGGFPQYENVYDPYMPYMEPGGPIVNGPRPYQSAAEYGNEYAPYPGPYLEPMITDSIRRSVIDSGRPITHKEIYNTLMDKDDPNAGRRTNQLYNAMQNPGPGAQYGGYQEGDVVDMTEAELGAFLRIGGQVEFVD